MGEKEEKKNNRWSDINNAPMYLHIWCNVKLHRASDYVPKRRKIPRPNVICWKIHFCWPSWCRRNFSLFYSKPSRRDPIPYEEIFISSKSARNLYIADRCNALFYLSINRENLISFAWRDVLSAGELYTVHTLYVPLCTVCYYADAGRIYEQSMVRFSVWPCKPCNSRNLPFAR